MLYLLPNALHESQKPPQYVGDVVKTLDGLYCETEKNARAYLKHYELKMPLQQFPLQTVNEHTKQSDAEELIQPLLRGETWAMVSDAGLCSIADPGSLIVQAAHKAGIKVVSLYGPSSILMALQLSGLSGQCFSFAGYLPREKEARQAAIRSREMRAKKEKETQIFIEAPYRNNELLVDLLSVLSPDTFLAVAWDLTAPTEGIVVQTVKAWKKMAPLDIHKKPALFLLSS